MSTLRLKEGDTRLCLLLTRVTKPESYGENYCHNVKIQPLSLEDGDVLHFLYIECISEKTVQFTAISLHHAKPHGFLVINLYELGEYNNALASHDISDLVHYHGYGKILGVRADDKRLNAIDMTDHVLNLHFKDWDYVWKNLNDIRRDRILDRFKKPREYEEDPDEDNLDMVLGKVIKRVNAIINNQLRNGLPHDDAYLDFHTGNHAFPI